MQKKVKTGGFSAIVGAISGMFTKVVQLCRLHAKKEKGKLFPRILHNCSTSLKRD